MNRIKLEERLERIEKLLLSNKTVFNILEACHYTGLSQSYLYKLTSLGLISFSKPNGKIIYFSRDKLDKWLLQNNHKSKADIQEEALKAAFRK